MADIRINDLPLEASPTPSEFVAIDGVSTRKSSIQKVVDAGAPVATQAKAEAGTDNIDRMTALTTKQSIDFNSVPLTRIVTAGPGLTGGGPLSANISLALSSTSLGSLALADTSVQPSRQVIAGAGLSGGGDLAANVTLSLSSATQTSLGLADTAIQDGSNALVPNGGTTGQVLVKNSNTNRDTTWATVAAATAVSYAPQSLNITQQSQARVNIGSEIRGYISPSFNLSNNATDAVNDIDFPAGSASSEQSPSFLMVHSAGTAQLDVAYGTGNGGRFDGAISDGWWNCFIISNGTLVGRGFSKSLDPTTQPNWPAGFTQFRRVGTIPRVSGSLAQFKQRDDRFYYSTVVTDRNSTAPRAFGVISLSIPLGIIVRPIIALDYQLGQNVSIRVTFGNGDGSCETRVIDAQTANTAGAIANQAATFEHFYSSTNSELFASQINNIGTPSLGTWSTLGWIDTRGK